jgi:hypothetical protein
MIYVTKPAPSITKQMSVFDLYFTDDPEPSRVIENDTCTRTTVHDPNSPKFRNLRDLYDVLYGNISHFNRRYAELREYNPESLYMTFYRAKSNKGMKRVFKDLFDTQKKYVECSSGAVCAAVASALKPVISQHPTEKDAEIKMEAYTSVMATLEESGFDTSLVDVDLLLRSSFRRIDAPNDALYGALLVLKDLLENDPFHGMYHTTAFAYIKGRSTLDAIKRHQKNESRWFAKYDLSNFFGSTTMDFTIKMLKMIFPFSVLLKTAEGEEALRTALSLGFLNGSLPQGTPLSPTLTNLFMIPIDHTLSRTLDNFDRRHFVYTRYADDFIISCKYDFSELKVRSLIKDTLNKFETPFSLNESKTRYGSSSGQNWNLGVMLNGNNEITVGHKKKREFKAMLHSYAMDRKNNKPWDRHEILAMEGLRSYYKMVEGGKIDAIVKYVGDKVGLDIPAAIKADLNPY